MRKSLFALIWLLVALLGAWAYYHIASTRHEPLNSGYILVAAICTYTIGFRFYAKWIAARVLTLNDRRATPCEVHEDGKDFVKTNKWIVFGHHFAAISGPGPLVGPVLAAQFGYLPGTLWILIGAVLGGAVQDFVILVASMRRDGRSLGQMVKDELNTTAGFIGVAAILAIMIILLAVLALVVVKALAESPWGVFTVGATIPIALFMGGYLRFLRIGKVMEVSVIGVGLLLLAVWGGKLVHADAYWHQVFLLKPEPLAWTIVGYGFLASVLPVWLLLAPRDYLSTFMKLGTITALAIGTLLVLPDLHMPALTKFVDGGGPVVPGSVFPFCFITIACGAISGFHSLISSGITPKIITRETHARSVGYGSMCLESFVAIMAMIAACTLSPGVYLAMNIPGGDPEATTQAVAKTELVAWGAVVNPVAGAPEYEMRPVAISPVSMQVLAHDMGEVSLYGRTGGAPTLAVGMAMIFSGLTGGRGLDYLYHFALMFEALFILTTLDAGTRVGRYLLQDACRRVSPRLGDVKNIWAGAVASAIIVLAWGFFLIMGVRDPDGGVKALWPIFGIANQLLASIALCLATTILIKMAVERAGAGGRKFPAICLVTLVPLVWLLTVTLSAGLLKVVSPKLSFFAAATAAEAKLPALEAKVATSLATEDSAAAKAAQKAVQNTRTLVFNNRVDGVVTTIFLALVAAIVLLCLREWWLLLTGRKAADSSETPPVWLDPALDATPAGGHPAGALGAAALAFALLKEVSGEAAIEREQQAAQQCNCAEAQTYKGRQNAFLTATNRRFDGVRRCC
ncbi:MAG TPA: carbon starvation CstA family protein [Chthoniobacteraceae bacterium]|jgi:carbon starvation protein|nr:carbon starvation CstA family protein [Chthoniobacteraceae bacterium]